MAGVIAVFHPSIVLGELPSPVLTTVFPSGGEAGASLEVTVSGSDLGGLRALRCSAPEVVFEHIEGNRFRASIPEHTPVGVYDVRVVCAAGMSSPRCFVVGNRREQVQTEPNESPEAAAVVPLDVVINGRIDKKGDVDCYRFAATGGQRVVIECEAERVDSALRAVLEVEDTSGRRLASNRGYFGIDPLVDFRAPTDGEYVVRLYDLKYEGGEDYVYRLAIDTGPRVAFAHPAVVQEARSGRVALYGWNLRGAAASDEGALDRLEVELAPPELGASSPAVYRHSYQADVAGFAYRLAGSHSPVFVSLTDVPVVQDGIENHSPGSAQPLEYPCEVAGRLAGGDETDWYSIEARRGEVLWLEGFGQRIGSPVDLDVAVLDERAERELARFGDELASLGDVRFPTSHLDPAGRWVVPADGRYLMVVRNLIGGVATDARRVYRLSVRREEPAFELTAVSMQRGPAGLNVPLGGREVVEILAFRRRGLDGAIRVTAEGLPAGVECPEIWLGPGVNRAPLVLSAHANSASFAGSLKLVGRADTGGAVIERAVVGGTMVREGTASGWGRITQELPLAVAGRAPLRVAASVKHTRGHILYGDLEVQHSQGSILDVAVQVERVDAVHTAGVELTGIGLPEVVSNTVATIPAGEDTGYMSFYLPPTMAPGRYSVAVRATTEAPFPVGDAEAKPTPVSAVSNAVTFDVAPAKFILEVDPRAPRKIRRGEYVQVQYTAKRKNGFIGKIHTELGAPDEVIGLRVRGVTFVGQTESGELQIVANEDAPLGRQPFLRLYGVGTVEDEPIYHGHCWLELEIVE